MERCRNLNTKSINEKGNYISVLVKRDYRLKNNWCFYNAIQLSKKYNKPIAVFVFVPNKVSDGKMPSKYSPFFPNQRHHHLFKNVITNFANELSKFNISLQVIRGNSPYEAMKNILKESVVLLTDFKPIKNFKAIDKDLIKNSPIRIIQTDSHNVIPAWVLSDKAEYSAHTFRLKAQKLQLQYLTKIPNYTSFKQKPIMKTILNLDEKYFDLHKDVSIIDLKMTYSEGYGKFKLFVEKKLKHYSDERNNSNNDVLSKMSTYVNWGVLSAQDLIYKINKLRKNDNVNTYLDELWIRREVADNFVNFKKDYEKTSSAWNWMQDLMKKEKYKTRYSLQELEDAKTDDALWNSSMCEWKNTGIMHGYMRMFWCKQIGVWNASKQRAMDISNYLNDKYSLDGYDSGGYTGVAWCLLGVHDRPFYGKLRPMTLNSQRKQLQPYIEKNIC
jgi:deoxyribodipyrimidine photo-lyase